MYNKNLIALAKTQSHDHWKQNMLDFVAIGHETVLPLLKKLKNSTLIDSVTNPCDKEECNGILIVMFANGEPWMLNVFGIDKKKMLPYTLHQEELPIKNRIFNGNNLIEISV